ncbi:hypothetical protein QQS21_011984 [Conoideocrella luteorostrata]|uniref:Uncharacterized protein n=1 Tax=Conoideocrella luteorostrata TaxID=1105319 RepID=A0AAJ0CCA9_9HYPO|nr:hypothetical protein QQS21_011984 [Conoideocrella luteorostrata]
MPLYESADPDAHVLSQFSLKGKIALVTGGSRGIGLEAVIGLAEAGADVAFIYKESTDAEDKATKIATKTRQRVQSYQCDVTDREKTRQTIETVASNFGHGRLDIVVVNAGVCNNIPALDYAEDEWHYTTRVNYDGAMWTCLAAGHIFKKQGRGNLIVTGSVSATLVNVPQPQSGYNATKAAVVHLAKNLAVEWANFARVNIISPGYVLTDMVTKRSDMFDDWLKLIPGRRMCKPEELRSVFVFLASDACCYMTGANLTVDGGYTLP